MKNLAIQRKGLLWGIAKSLLIYCRNATLNFSSLEQSVTSTSILPYMNYIPSFLPWNWPGFPEAKTQQRTLRGSYSELTEKGLECSRCTSEATYLTVKIWIFLAALTLLTLRIRLFRGCGCSPLIVC